MGRANPALELSIASSRAVLLIANPEAIRVACAGVLLALRMPDAVGGTWHRESAGGQSGEQCCGGNEGFHVVLFVAG